MKRHRWYRALAAAALVMVVSLTAGCLTITGPEESAQPSTAPEETAPPSTVPQEPSRRPVVNRFTATPETISLGQSATLSWDVSDATAVTIQPSIGGVGQSGSQQLSPTRSTTYTLTATNTAGDSMRTLTVTVTPAAAGTPDLEVTDVWLAGQIYYKLRNRGSGDAKSSQSNLYVGDLKQATDYVQPLAAGEERTECFSNYQWSYGGAEGSTEGFHIKVCADVENALAESHEGNNCGSLFFGTTLPGN